VKSPLVPGPMTARSRLDVTEITVRSARLPRAFDGFRVGVLTDLHYGPFVRAGFVRRVVERARGLRLDLAVLGGDMTNRPGPASAELASMLAPLAAEVPTYAVLGSHDYAGGGAGRYCDHMRSVGVEVLVNANRLLTRGGAERIGLLGLDDYHQGTPRPRAAFAGLPEGLFTLLAVHCPDLLDGVADAGRVDLALCGHTHGGQIAFFGWAPVTFTRNRRYRRGLIEGPGFPAYVSRGLGMTGLPIRLGASPELPVITLRTEGQ